MNGDVQIAGESVLQFKVVARSVLFAGSRCGQVKPEISRTAASVTPRRCIWAWACGVRIASGYARIVTALTIGQGNRCFQRGDGRFLDSASYVDEPGRVNVARPQQRADTLPPSH